MPSFFRFAAGALLLVLFAGCQDRAPERQVASGDATGSIRVGVRWPDLPGGDRYIAPSTQKIVVAAYQNGIKCGEITLEREPGQTAAAGTLTGVPAKETVVSGRALTSRGTEIGYGEATVTVASGGIMSAVLVLNSLHYVYDGVFRSGAGTGPGQLQSPADIACDRYGYVYVADCFNNRIQVFNTTGAYLRSWSVPHPHGLAMDANDRLSVTSDNAIRVYSRYGNLVKTLTPDLDNPLGVCVDAAGRTYIADTYHQMVKRLDPLGQLNLTITTPSSRQSTADARFEPRGSGPVAVDVDSLGHIYVAMHDAQTILVYDKDGNFLRDWGAPGTGPGEFQNIQDLQIVGGNRLLVTDHTGNRVQIFTLAGEYLGEFGLNIQSDGVAFDCVHSLAVDFNGTIYVSDFAGNRIHRFKPVTTGGTR